MFKIKGTKSQGSFYCDKCKSVNNNNNNLQITKYNDFELNVLNYKEAILSNLHLSKITATLTFSSFYFEQNPEKLIDKRNYYQYYLSLLTLQIF